MAKTGKEGTILNSARYAKEMVRSCGDDACRTMDKRRLTQAKLEVEQTP